MTESCVCEHGGKNCSERCDGWVCTREEGHKGKHVACGPAHYCHTWKTEPTIEEMFDERFIGTE